MNNTGAMGILTDAAVPVIGARLGNAGPPPGIPRPARVSGAVAARVRCVFSTNPVDRSVHIL